MKKILLIMCLFTFHYSNASSILFLGDSLTEGLGVDKEKAYPKLVENMLQKEVKKDIKVINGGVSGSTTSDGLARLRWYLKRKPSIVFIALGANDGLRGLDLKQSQKNLEEIVFYAKKADAKVLLAGMLIPPNYGQEYANNFEKMYKEVKNKYKLKSMDFLLKDVAGIKELNQNDGIHPNTQGHKVIAKNVFKFIKEEL
ncbi:arylesterase [Poseidonibacter parvus]|uniref:Arylesterase n=1 Tax=Poseidonibacter parvus TaxID=1850254 RepID=A0A1P8KM93_9BACT|nr:arylesterase [Poseidonibacter parvus]APW65648.1 arylesterase [Poseidonibacter parvus]